MARTYQQDNQMVHDAALPVMGQTARKELKDIIAAIDGNFKFPVRIAAAPTTPDAKLYIQPQQYAFSDGAGMSVGPIATNIPTLVATTIDFQTQTVVGGTVNITWPASTVGQFRRLGFTLLSTGAITATFSAEAASVGALANAGTLMSSNGFTFGWIDLECTHVSGLFKTAGSATSIIENAVGGTSRIVRCPAGGIGTTFDPNTILTSNGEVLVNGAGNVLISG